MRLSSQSSTQAGQAMWRQNCDERYTPQKVRWNLKRSASKRTLLYHVCLAECSWNCSRKDSSSLAGIGQQVQKGNGCLITSNKWLHRKMLHKKMLTRDKATRMGTTRKWQERNRYMKAQAVVFLSDSYSLLGVPCLGVPNPFPLRE